MARRDGNTTTSNPVFQHKLSSNTATYNRQNTSFQLRQPLPQGQLSRSSSTQQRQQQGYIDQRQGHQGIGEAVARHRNSAQAQDLRHLHSERQGPGQVQAQAQGQGPPKYVYGGSVQGSEVESRDGAARLHSRRAGK